MVCWVGFVSGQAARPTPPVAKRVDHTQVWHGETLNDPYFWLREKSAPDVANYLEAENAYTEAMTAGLAPFRDALYKEMLARIKQTDLGVPARDGKFYYYSRTVEGQQYPLHCRKPAAADGAYRADAPELVMLDQNEMAKGLTFLGIGAAQVSDDGNLLALFDRHHRLPPVHAARQGARHPPRLCRHGRARHVRRVGDRQPDAVLRHRGQGDQAPDQLWRLKLGSAPGVGLRGEGRALRHRRRPDEGQALPGARR